MLLQVTFAVLVLLSIGLVWPRHGKKNVQWITEGVLPWSPCPSFVTVETAGDESFRYLVNGSPQLFIGMGYNPIYRYLSDEERAANYDRDFQILCEAGVNHIIGWDADKGYEQDKFDELTLDYAEKYGIGVVMPFYLPPEGDYTDEGFTESLKEEAARKVERYKDHPALRLWGVGNEVLAEMPEGPMWGDFCRFYLELTDMIHDLDPNHPVIYREAEDAFMSAIEKGLRGNAKERPWLLYGMNIYTMELERILDAWPPEGVHCPLIVTEFGAEPSSDGGRAMEYLNMWRMIRAHPEQVLGGAPYAWTIAGPEPTDVIWGLMDENSQPVDDTFEQLAAEWRKENEGQRSCP
jgi:beta-galactosidase/beta-glucuronidase